MNEHDRQQDILWWKHGVLYQIYPRSFADSNGDGIGDIPGLTGRLDYLKDLGISGIWLSPVFPSPMKDFGYDISDYRGIDAVFGNLSDLRILVDEAHKRDIRVILDMVFNHSSNLHPWFIESRRSRDNSLRDWYIWHPGKNGKMKSRGRPKPPNNWRAAFGGRSWSWDENSREYYLHLFLEGQPDLNWRNGDVRQALFDVLRFWMEIGVDGFRFDVINFIVKDMDFRSNPYKLHKALPRRFEQQDHRYDRTRPESHEYLKELRDVLDEYPERMSVGEVFPNEGIIDHSAVSSYLGDGSDELHLAFDFSLNYVRFRAGDIAAALRGQYESLPESGWPVHVLSNHDQSRAMSRLAKGDPLKMKLLLTLLLTLRGTPFLYYGDEIGMSDGRIPRNRLQDPVGIRYWPFHPGRDPARTPMQWTDTPGAGFSPAEPWLPLPADFSDANVAAQNGNPDSILELTRSLIGLRHNRRSLSHGGWELLESPSDILAYSRRDGRERTIILLNFSSGKQTVELEGGPNIIRTVLSDNLRPVGKAFEPVPGNRVRLQGLQALVLSG